MTDQTVMPEDIATMSFEEAMSALESIVSRLETGNAPLEDSIDLYTRGTLLKRHCEDKLASAQARIEKINVGENGQAVDTSPLDVDN